MSNLYLEVCADTNDGDYVTERTTTTEEEVAKYQPLFEAIRNCEASYNWPDYEGSDVSPEDVYPELKNLVEDFREWGYVPHAEYGVHTIVSVKLIEVVKEIDLLWKNSEISLDNDAKIC